MGLTNSLRAVYGWIKLDLVWDLALLRMGGSWAC